MERKIPSAGCTTAMATAFEKDGKFDREGQKKNIRFQVLEGVNGILSMGTSGESSTVDYDEHNMINKITIRTAKPFAKEKGGNIFVWAGCGSNSTKESEAFIKPILDEVDGILLVDPYYNRPSTLEMRENYYGAIAYRFRSWDFAIMPYTIPSRTGCTLSVEDLAILAERFGSICAVKDATGDFERVKRIRSLTPEGFMIFSGDDDKTYKMMTDPDILASGVVSVVSNIAPRAVQRLCDKIFTGDQEYALRIQEALNPLFKVVTVTAAREEASGVVEDRFPNPLPIKTMMAGLGMPAGPCRRPLGKMTSLGVEKVRSALQEVWKNNSWILEPIEEYYEVSILNRLSDNDIWAEMSYEGIPQ